MLLIHASDIGCTGRESTRAFQMLLAGNIGHFAIVGPFPLGVEGTTVLMTAVSIGTFVSGWVGALDVSMIDVGVDCVEAGMQADKVKTATIRVIFVPINRSHCRWFA